MLNNHTYYSLRFGVVSPDELLDLGKELGYNRLVLTDINCTAGVLEFFRQAPKREIAPFCGIDFRNGADQKFVAITKNNAGFQELNEFLSAHLHEEKSFDLRAPHFDNAFVIYPFQVVGSVSSIKEQKRAKKEREPEQEFALPTPKNLLPHEFIGISVRDIPRLRFSEWKNHRDKLVVLNTSTFRYKRDFNAHRLLRAIDNNTLLSKLPKSEEGLETDVFISKEELIHQFAEFPELLENTEKLLDACTTHFEFGSGEHQNQMNYSGNAQEDEKLLHELCAKGLLYRYPNADEHVRKRLEKELQIIKEKGFIAYFLINWDITAYARKRGFFYVGRGSGANSVVAYLLRITDVDPIELDLYFERFINLFRQNPPDFDIDFSWREREEMTEYIFSRFKNVSLLGAFVTFQYSAVVRELGKVFGLPKEDIDMLSDRKFKEADLDSLHKLVLYYSHYIHGFPNYIGIHAAGILITEKPTHFFGATFMPPKGFPTVQFDMHQAEDVGINKLDILSQRGLAKIRDAMDLIAVNQPEKANFDIHDVKRFKDDDRCNELLRTANAIGCFYVESPAMRMLLLKLQTHNYLGLVAASSVIRPGVSSSGMMRQFILRERIPEKRLEAPKPLLDLMPETYGVMVYQEDVIKVAHYFAGLSLGEADVLRRGMSGKFRGREEFEHARKKFHDGAIERGHGETLTNEVWRQVESFAGYAFAKGHSASYAVESYQCLFLKAYFPLEYMTATINNFGGFYRTEIYVHEARMNGAIIAAPCVNTSDYLSTIRGKEITLGFQHIKSLEHNAVDEVLKARRDGLFLSLDDFL
ncbi:MAG: DNA polymerase III subunit alpha, partial [Flavobacteriales bacterium]